MDAEKLLQAFTSEEHQEIAAALPVKIIQAQAERLGLIAANAGETATQAAIKEILHNESLEAKAASYLNPEADLNVEQQLKIMSEFWGTLSRHQLPELNPDQITSLEAAVSEAAPGQRIMPTPLLKFHERKSVAEHAKTLPKTSFNDNLDALWTPDESWIFGKLLRNPESTVKEDGRTYGLRYKAPNGEIVSLDDYITAMKQAGQAVGDDVVWVFPVIDVRQKSPRQYARASELHAQVVPAVTPDALLTMQLLHQVAGTSNPNWEVDFANEAVYELDKKGDPKALVRVASVYWHPGNRHVRLDLWRADFRDGDFGVRVAESGL